MVELMGWKMMSGGGFPDSDIPEPLLQMELVSILSSL